MSDDDRLRPMAQRARINLNDPSEVRYWCTELRCSESQLRDAIHRVGAATVRVRAFLGH